jgi:2Fe-2S ferredoxin
MKYTVSQFSLSKNEVTRFDREATARVTKAQDEASMIRFVIVTHDDVEHTIEAEENRTLMETIRDRGFSELRALCGGCCSCATCHVYVDPAFGPKLPAMSEDEDALLDGADSRRETSRLSCQIHLTEKLDGLKVTIAPHD